MIKSCGLYWKRDCVFWGSPGKGNQGHLIGEGPASSPLKKQIQVDFRDQAGLYILYDENRNVVYVGQAGRGNNKLFSRLKHHTWDHLADRWVAFSWFGIFEYKIDNRKKDKIGVLNIEDDAEQTSRTSNTLNIIEGLLLTALEPPLNKQGARWHTVNQFSQVADEIQTASDRQLLLEIHQKLYQSS